MKVMVDIQTKTEKRGRKPKLATPSACKQRETYASDPSFRQQKLNLASKWNKDNIERYRENQRRWRENNKDRLEEYKRRYANGGSALHALLETAKQQDNVLTAYIERVDGQDVVIKVYRPSPRPRGLTAAPSV